MFIDKARMTLKAGKGEMAVALFGEKSLLNVEDLMEEMVEEVVPSILRLLMTLLH